MNVEKLRELQKFIQIEPRRFSMKEGLRKFRATRFESEVVFLRSLQLIEMPPCQTAACLAGEAVLMEHPDNNSEVWFDVFEDARGILSLTKTQAIRLFYFNRPSQYDADGADYSFANRYEAAATPKERVQVAVEFIDHFIRTETERGEKNADGIINPYPRVQ